LNRSTIVDLGYTLNGAMFARNGRSGFVLKPEPLRIKMKEENIRRIKHVLTIKVSCTSNPLYRLRCHRITLISCLVLSTCLPPDHLRSTTSSPSLIQQHPLLLYQSRQKPRPLRLPLPSRPNLTPDLLNALSPVLDTSRLSYPNPPHQNPLHRRQRLQPGLERVPHALLGRRRGHG
jgi:hypothetical protein